MWKSTGYIAKHEHVTNECVQNWIRQGKYDKVHRTKGGHYRIWIDEPEKIYLYARVSSKKQETSLLKQQELLKSKYANGTFISDIGSGFNQHRPGYKSILEQAINGTKLHIVATTSDRITRTGFGLIKWIVELSGGRITILEETSESSEKFDSETLIAFITSFVNSYYGKRSHRRSKRFTEDTSIS